MKLIPFSPNWNPSEITSLPELGESWAGLHPLPDTKEPTRVVVADDDAITRDIVSSLLTSWGYTVLATHDGHEAMEALREQPTPVLALLDWMMPGLDGLEICRRVREVKRNIYIILLSARSSKQDMVAGLQAGADDYLIKPFDKDELHARVLVGLRIMGLQEALVHRVNQLEAALREINALKLQLPL